VGGATARAKDLPDKAKRAVGNKILKKKERVYREHAGHDSKRL